MCYATYNRNYNEFVLQININRYLDKIEIFFVLNKYGCPEFLFLDNSIIFYLCHVYSKICEIFYIKIKQYLNFKINKLDLVDE